jgi:hypothetical protein
MYTKHKLTMYLLILLAGVLSGCSSTPKLVAPEIDPPADLIPGYVPEGFDLVEGYQVEAQDFIAPTFSTDDEDSDEDARIICDVDMSAISFDLRNPAGNDTLGVHYQNGDSLLLITKSYYPGGSLETWRTAYEASGSTAGCNCECFAFAIQPPVPLRDEQIQEERTIDGTRVAILKGARGWTVVFVRGDYLIAVESDISLEEILKVVASLPEN